MPTSSFTGVSSLSIEQIELGRRESAADRLELKTYRPLEELRANPFHPSDAPLTFAYFVDGEAVARLHTIRDRVQLDGGQRDWIWVSSQLTLPSHRGRGLMSQILEEVLSTATRQGAWVGAPGVTPGGRAVYRKAGLGLVETAPRQVLPLRTDVFLMPYIGAVGIRKAVALMPDLLLKAQRGLISVSLGKAVQSFEVETPDSFGFDVQPLADTNPQFPRMSREQRKMQWRWERVCSRRNPPHRDYRLVTIRRKGAGDLAAFAILRLAKFDRPGGLKATDLRVVTILDWATGYHDALAKKALLNVIVGCALSMGADVLEFSTSDESMQSMLKLRGFLSVGHYRLFCHTGGVARIGETAGPSLSHFWWNGADAEDTYTW